ncbi:hypothetical protein F5Y09DRAFT_320727, partial [Xylaria sp. FL1042]
MRIAIIFSSVMHAAGQELTIGSQLVRMTTSVGCRCLRQYLRCDEGSALATIFSVLHHTALGMWLFSLAIKGNRCCMMH